MMNSHAMQRREFLAMGAAGLAAGLSSGVLGRSLAHAAEVAPPKFARAGDKPNVLFIIMDDLRPALGCYGATQVHSPTIDRLAGEGSLFQHAYCQYPVCNPSRLSFMTGLRPNSTKTYDNNTIWPPEVHTPSLPAYFKQQGYASLAVGKVYHQPMHADLNAFTEKPVCLDTHNYLLDENKQRMQQILDDAKAHNTPWEQYGAKLLVAATEDAPVADDAYNEGRHAKMALDYIDKYQHQPFCLAVGFFRPHMPFVAPRKYWDLYQREKLDLDPYQGPILHGSAYPLHDNFEPKCYGDIPQDEHFSEDIQRRLLHGYYASISYIDAQIAVILDRLEKLGLRKNTVIALIGDNGYHLGEHNLWGKFTTLENAARCPLIMNGPGVPAGMRSHELAEFVDIYPTFCELSGLERPGHLQGESLVPVMRHGQPGKEYTLTQFQKSTAMGCSLRTRRHRYTEWVDHGKLVSTELYDYDREPFETVNHAEDAEYREVRADLSARLRKAYELKLS